MAHGVVTQVTRYFFTTCQVIGSAPSLEIAGFCIHISDFSILCIHILTQLMKER